MADKAEIVVRWYLRFNRYFGIENLVLHEPRHGVVPQGGEVDVLAVRFPYSKELAGFEIPSHPKIIDPEAEKNSLIDLVIAEVKSGRKTNLNTVWRGEDPDGTKVGRISYLIRWVGFFKDEAEIQDIASELRQKYRCRRNGYLLRLVYFSPKERRQIRALNIPEITFRDIAEFFVSDRTPCWEEHGLGLRSCHDQWDPLIKEIWRRADPYTPGTREEKIRTILQLIQESRD